MAENRHKTIIDVVANEQQAAAAADKLQAKYDKLLATVQKIQAAWDAMGGRGGGSLPGSGGSTAGGGGGSAASGLGARPGGNRGAGGAAGAAPAGTDAPPSGSTAGGGGSGGSAPPGGGGSTSSGAGAGRGGPGGGSGGTSIPPGGSAGSGAGSGPSGAPGPRPGGPGQPGGQPRDSRGRFTGSGDPNNPNRRGFDHAPHWSSMASIFSNPAAMPVFAAMRAGQWATQWGLHRMGNGGGMSAMMLRGIGASIPFAGVAAMGLADRFQRAQTLGQVNRSLGMAGLTGFRPGYSGPAALGFSPQESAGIAQSYAQMVGHRTGRGAHGNVFRMLLSGVGVGALAGYTGLGAAGAGGVGGNVRNALKLAFADGLRGANLDRYLAQIASSTSQLAAAGVNVNMAGVESFIGGLRGTVGDGEGLRLPAFHSSLAADVGGVRQQLLAPFAQLGRAAVLARAMRESKGAGLGGLIGALDGAGMGDTGPGGYAFDAIQQMFPGAANLIFAGKGMRFEAAQQLAAKGLTMGQPVPDIGAAGGRGLASLMASHESQLLGNLGMDDARSLITSVNTIRGGIDEIGAMTQELIEVIKNGIDLLSSL